MAMTEESVDQVEVNCLCVQHGQSCNNTRCFVKEGLRANWFYNPVLEEFAIPDSYQEGHGVNVKITFSHRSRNTGQIPLCLSNGTCHISEKGLHFSANFSKDGLYIAIINETNYHAAEHYYLVYIYENCHQMPYDSPRHTGHNGTSFNWSMGLWLVKCSHNKTFFLPFVLDSAKSAPIIMTETAITIYISMIFLIVSLLTFLNVLITLNNKYKHYGV
uniref:Early E3 25 kDa glycoprotein n=1 Tax=Canine adenovirus serotype 1 (strain CLL) TaxID=69150 RepID=E325_ADECC|nr:RecName: Full=Early E3 25 kDa glycoprotein [Canine adenovirus 1 strain CLL]AAB05449.1 putative E3 [Canine adenovirus 1]